VAFLACATLVHAAASDKLSIVARAGQVGTLRLAYAAHSRDALYAGTAMPQRLLVEVRYPSGAGAVATTTRIDGDAARLVADGFGASPPKDVGPVSVSVVTCRVDQKRTDCRCASFSDCRSRSVAAQDVKLVCHDGTPDDACSARRSRCFTAECLLDDWNGDGKRLIDCAGDSNTSGTGGPSWCRRMSWWLDDFETRLAAWPGTRAADDQERALGAPVSAQFFLGRMLGRKPVADMAVLAWGTNDVFVHSAEEIVAAIDVLAERVRKEHVVPIVATIPWLYDMPPGTNLRVAVVNANLRARYAPCLIDFTNITPATSTWYLDRRHLNQAGQDRRALAALYTLATMPRSCADGAVRRH
jgi:lysophospholipase L1-like esterase